jgi:methylamine dehydrogenase accessory protein MauD
MLLVSQALLWIVVLGLAVAVLALARQIGVLHERIAPVGALAIGQGPQPGQAAPRVVGRTLDGGGLTIGDLPPGAVGQLLFFLSPICPVCKQLLPTAKAFATAEDLDFIAVGDGDAGQHREMARRFALDERRFINGPEVGQSYHVGKLPYAVLIARDGLIVSQGLVNTREHLESLMAVGETGFRSVQDYIRAGNIGHVGETRIASGQEIAKHG